MKKNYGLVISKEKDPNAFILGGFASLPKIILQADGQWDKFLPEREAQTNNELTETYNCTGYGTNAVLETLLNKLGKLQGDKSDRWLGIRAGTKPPGNDPQKVAKTARGYGVIAESTLSFKGVFTTDEYYSFKGGNEMNCDLQGQDFLNTFDIGYEYVWDNPVSKEERMKRVQEALQYSPLGLSVSAWNEKNGVYVDNGQPNNHWVMAYGWNAQGIKILDTYDGFYKIVAWEHNSQVCLRYQLTPSTRKQQLGFLAQIVQLLSQWLGLIEQSTPTPNVPVIEAQPQPEPPKPSVVDFANAIQVFEGWFPPSAEYPNGTTSWRNKNPGNIRGANGAFLKFPTADAGFKYLCDYIRRVAKNEHKAYPKNCDIKQFFLVYAPVGDNNHPISYGVWISHRLGVTPSFLVKDLV